MKLEPTWTCPECGAKVPIAVVVKSGVVEEGLAAVRVTVPRTALADAFAHAWTHMESS